MLPPSNILEVQCVHDDGDSWLLGAYAINTWTRPPELVRSKPRVPREAERTVHGDPGYLSVWRPRPLDGSEVWQCGVHAGRVVTADRVVIAHLLTRQERVWHVININAPDVTHYGFSMTEPT